MTKSNGITSVFNREKGQDNKIPTLRNGSRQHTYMEHDEVTSPTVSMEGTLLTAVIEAQEGQDVATCNIPNRFIQTHAEEKDKDGN